MNCEINPECRERFDRIDSRLDKGDDEFKDHGEKIVELKTDMAHLTKSLDGVTKALWGVTVSIAMTLIGFFVWYIENIKH